MQIIGNGTYGMSNSLMIPRLEPKQFYAFSLLFIPNSNKNKNYKRQRIGKVSVYVGGCYLGPWMIELEFYSRIHGPDELFQIQFIPKIQPALVCNAWQGKEILQANTVPIEIKELIQQFYNGGHHEQYTDVPTFGIKHTKYSFKGAEYIKGQTQLYSYNWQGNNRKIDQYTGRDWKYISLNVSGLGSWNDFIKIKDPIKKFIKVNLAIFVNMRTDCIKNLIEK